MNPGGAQIFNIKWLDGGSNAVIARLGAHGAFVDDNFAKTHHLKIGSPLTLTAPTGKSVDLHVTRHLQAADRRLAVRAGDDLRRGLGQHLRLAAEPLFVRPDARRRDGRERRRRSRSS